MTTHFTKLKKPQKGDKIAILSPSFAAPGKWPLVYQLGLKRVHEIFGLDPIEFPTTKKIGASKEDRSKDLVNAFENPEIKAVISSLGGDDQITYVKNLPDKPFANNPKPFFGYSDNTHFMNHLWLNGVPSFYGGALFTQFALQGKMDDLTIKYLKLALFEDTNAALDVSDNYSDIGLDWNDPETLNQTRKYEPNEGWYWDGKTSAEGISWGGCLESIDEMLRHGIKIPELDQFKNIVLFTETSEEMPSDDYVFRVYRALGERGILERVKGVLIGRPKAWEFGNEKSLKEKKIYREKQRAAILNTVRTYNKLIPVVQNIDFGHTEPQICLPCGSKIEIDSQNKRISARF